MAEVLQFGGNVLWTYLLHSTVLLGSVALLDRLGWLSRWRVAESAWRGAMLGAWLTTAAALMLSGFQSDVQGRAPHAASVSAAAAEPPPQRSLAGPRATQPSPSAAVVPVPSSAPGTAGEPRFALGLALVSPLLVAIWTLGCCVALLHLLLQVGALVRRVRQLPAWPDAELEHQLGRMAQQAGLSPPRLRCCATSQSPWAWLGTIALPAWGAQGLTRTELSAVLAHELNHLRRRDPLWRLATELAARAGWLQVLNRLALRRLDELAEQACDAGAVQLIGNPAPLAQGLLRCAEQLQRFSPRPRSTAPRLAHAMASRPAPLLARMRHLLEHSNMSYIPNRTARWALALCLGLTAVALPAAILKHDDSSLLDWMAEALPENLVRFNGSFNFIGHKHTVVRGGSRGQSVELRWRGKLHVNEEQTDVLRADGPVQFRETLGGERREWQLTPQADGSLQRVYRFNGKEAPVDTEWLSKMIRMALDATQPPLERAQQRFAKGGTPALLADIDASGSAYQRRQRIEASLEAVPEAQRHAALVQDLLQRTQAIDSDFERRHVLQRLAALPNLQESHWLTLLGSTATLGSDFERSEVLGSIAAALPNTEAIQAAWLAAHQASSSAFERHRALEALLSRGKGDWRSTALLGLEGMGRDFELRQSLSEIAEKLEASDTALMQSYLKAAKSLGSDFEHRQALQALLARKPTDATVLRELLANGASVDSGFERLQVLQAAAPLLPRDGSLDADYRLAARSLSTYERGQAEQALDR